MRKVKGLVFPLLVLVLAGGGVWWFLTPSNLPGEAVADLGRKHIADAEPDPVYNSNPPTSGPHSPQPASSGFYESERNDRNLIHSLEHGYVVISYNCQIAEKSGARGKGQEATVWAHEEEEGSEEGSQASPSAAVRENQFCHELQDYLRSLVKKYQEWKIIAVPRPNLETTLALTAWGRIDKFSLSEKLGVTQDVDQRINRFIKAWRNKGPEATRE